MINIAYAKAYTEVLEIIKYFPKEEYDKILKTLTKEELIKILENNNNYIIGLDKKEEKLNTHSNI